MATSTLENLLNLGPFNKNICLVTFLRKFIMRIFLFIFILFLSVSFFKTSTAKAAIVKTYWSGSYTCSDGKKAVTLELSLENNRIGKATFNFGPLTSGVNVKSGSFLLGARFNSSRNRLELRPLRWLKRAEGISMVGVVGGFSDGLNKFNGRIKHSACKEITLTRKKQPATITTKKVTQSKPSTNVQKQARKKSETARRRKKHSVVTSTKNPTKLDSYDLAGKWLGISICNFRPKTIHLNIERLNSNTYSARLISDRVAKFMITPKSKGGYKADIIKGNIREDIEFHNETNKPPLMILDIDNICGSAFFVKHQPITILGGLYKERSFLSQIANQQNFCSKVVRPWLQESELTIGRIKLLSKDFTIELEELKMDYLATHVLFEDSHFEKFFGAPVSNIENDTFSKLLSQIKSCVLLYGTKQLKTFAGETHLFDENSINKARKDIKSNSVFNGENLKPVSFLYILSRDIKSKPKTISFSSLINTKNLSQMTERDIRGALVKAAPKLHLVKHPELEVELNKINSRVRKLNTQNLVSSARNEKKNIPNSSKTRGFLSWPAIPEDYYVVNSHFGVRHYAHKDFSCEKPEIITNALSKIPSQYLVDAYIETFKELRGACEYDSKRQYWETWAAGMAIDVKLHIANQLHSSFTLRVGQDLQKAGIGIMAVTNYQILDNDVLDADSTIAKYWKNPRNSQRIDRHALITSGNELTQGDFNYVLATEYKKDNYVRDVIYHHINYFDPATYKTALNYRYLDFNWQPIKITNEDYLKRAAILGVPKAQLMMLKKNKKNIYVNNRELHNGSVQEHIQAIKNLQKIRNFRVLAGIQIAKAQGFDIKDAVFSKGKIRTSVVSPTTTQIEDAIVDALSRSKCGYLEHIYNSHGLEKNVGRLDWMAQMIEKNGVCFNRLAESLVNSKPFGGHSIKIGLNKVSSFSCTKNKQEYECSVIIKMGCSYEAPQTTFGAPPDPQTQFIEKQYCRPYRTYAIKPSKWVFTTKQQNDGQTYYWVADPIQ